MSRFYESLIQTQVSQNMNVDVPKYESNVNPVNRQVSGPPPTVATEDDGWTAVSNRRNKGNELSENGIGASISADQYVSDVSALRNIIEDVYRGIKPKPLVISPGGFFHATWFKEFVTKAGKSMDVITHHIYNLRPGVDEHISQKILDPSYLDGEAKTFNSLKNILKSSGTSSTAWVGEAGGAYNSGHHLVSDAFVNSFWLL